MRKLISILILAFITSPLIAQSTLRETKTERLSLFGYAGNPPSCRDGVLTLYYDSTAHALKMSADACSTFTSISSSSIGSSPVALQATTPGTKQTGHMNISGTVLSGGVKTQQPSASGSDATVTSSNELSCFCRVSSPSIHADDLVVGQSFTIGGETGTVILIVGDAIHVAANMNGTPLHYVAGAVNQTWSYVGSTRPGIFTRAGTISGRYLELRNASGDQGTMALLQASTSQTTLRVTNSAPVCDGCAALSVGADHNIAGLFEGANDTPDALSGVVSVTNDSNVGFTAAITARAVAAHSYGVRATGGDGGVFGESAADATASTGVIGYGHATGADAAGVFGQQIADSTNATYGGSFLNAGTHANNYGVQASSIGGPSAWFAPSTNANTSPTLLVREGIGAQGATVPQIAVDNDANVRTFAVRANGTIAHNGGVLDIVAAGAPSGACVTGSMYRRTDGTAGATLYICEATTWAAK